MKTKFLFIVVLIASLASLSSCEYDHTVTADPNPIVLASGESVKVTIAGNSVWISEDFTLFNHHSDSIFSIDDFKRKSLVVTGNSIGVDTLVIQFGRGIYNNGEEVYVPVIVEE